MRFGLNCRPVRGVFVCHIYFSILCNLDGQKVVKRILGQVQVVNKQIRDNITTYNNLQSVHHSGIDYPNTISYEEVINSDWPGWKKVACDIMHVCVSARRQAIDTYCSSRRATEELAMCRAEMRNVVTFLQQECEKCKVVIHQLREAESDTDYPNLYAVGAICLAQQKLLHLNFELNTALSAFNKIIIDGLPDDLPASDDISDSVNVEPSHDFLETFSENDDDNDDDWATDSESDIDSDCELDNNINGGP